MKVYDATVWTDGSVGNSGCGGAAAVLFSEKGKRLVVTNGFPAPTTNQRMELQAAIIGLNRLWWRADKFESARIRSKKRVVLFSDSAYLTNCFIQGWIESWRARDWHKADGKEVKNREFWETLENLVVQYKEVKFVHVKGHAGNANNELADQQAVLTRVAMEIRADHIKRAGDLPEPTFKSPFPKPAAAVSRSRSRRAAKKAKRSRTGR